MAGKWSFTFFGEPLILCDGKPVTGFISVKTQALLCYLVATAQPQARDHLATLFWGDMSTATARRNLTKALSNLRKIAGQILLIERHHVQWLDHSDTTVDLHQFQRCLAIVETDLALSAIDRVRQADKFYQAEFLQDFVVRDVPDFELWVETMRGELHTMLVNALDNTAAEALLSGDLTVAEQLTQRTLHHDPLREDAHRRAIELFNRQGKRAEALAHFEKCRHLLAEELAIEPSSELTELYETIKGHELPLPHNIPTPTTSFIGRESELLALIALLDNEDCRLLTITGAGGIGKTRLALQLAAQVIEPTRLPRPQRSFRHGIYFLPLTSLNTVDGLIALLAENLGFTFYEEGNLRQQLMDALHDRRMLLILDNVEHLVEHAPIHRGNEPGSVLNPSPLSSASTLIRLIDEILSGSPHIKVVVTSRTRLNMHGEHLFSLGGLHYPAAASNLPASGKAMPMVRSFALDEGYSATELFVQSARRLQPDYVVLDTDWPAVVRICQLVQGMPLGILLAAAWMDIYSPIEIADEISHSLDFLEADLPDLPSRQQSIRAAIDHSWRMLAQQEQNLFERLSIFRGSFSRQAAQQVAHATPRLLQALVRKSLLQPVVQGRFVLHELLRQYAEEKLDNTSPTALEIRNRHSAYFVQATVVWTPALKNEHQQRTLKEMEVDSENLRVAWQWLVAQIDVAQLLAMVNGLSQFYAWRGRYQEGAETSRLALSRLRFLQDPDDPVAFARLQVLLTIWHAIFLRLLGKVVDAQQQLQSALTQLENAILSVEETRAEAAFAWLHLGNTLRDIDRQAAQDAYEESLAAYRAIDEQWGLANALDAYGWLIQHFGAYEQAQRLYQESLTIRRQLQDQRGIAGSLRALGGITLYQGYHREAEQQIRQSITIYSDMDDQAGMAAALGKLGETLTLLGRAREAIDPLEESIPIYHMLGLQNEEMFARAVLAHAYIHAGDNDLALHTLEPAKHYFYRTDSQRGIAYVELIAGWAYLACDDLAAAEKALQKSVTIYAKIGQLDELGQAQALLGICAYQRSDFTEAAQYYEMASSTAKQINAFMPLTLARALARLLSPHVAAGASNRQGAIREGDHALVSNSVWFTAILST